MNNLPQITTKSKSRTSFSLSNKRRLQLIEWLKQKYFPVPEDLPLAKLMWRKGNNKALDDVIALLQYNGEYRETTTEEILENIEQRNRDKAA